jgi:hypothetical protein
MTNESDAVNAFELVSGHFVCLQRAVAFAEDTAPVVDRKAGVVEFLQCVEWAVMRRRARKFPPLKVVSGELFLPKAA